MLLLFVTCCHSLPLFVPLVFIRCTTRCHLLSFVVTCCTIRFHTLSFDVSSLVCLFINDHEASRVINLFIKFFVAAMMEILKNNLFKCGIESDITFTKLSGHVSQYILRCRSLWHPLSKSMTKNKRNVSLDIFRTSVCSLSMTVQIGLANNHIK